MKVALHPAIVRRKLQLDKGRYTETTLVALLNSSGVVNTIGYAFCNDEADAHIKRVGRATAAQRAVSAFVQQKHVMPFGGPKFQVRRANRLLGIGWKDEFGGLVVQTKADDTIFPEDLRTEFAHALSHKDKIIIDTDTGNWHWEFPKE